MTRRTVRTLCTLALTAGIAAVTNGCGKAPVASDSTTSTQRDQSASALAVPAAKPDERPIPANAATVTVAIGNMHCDACVGHITETLQATDGVCREEVSLEKKNAVITYDPTKTQPAALVEALKAIKYNASWEGAEPATAPEPQAAATTPDAPATPTPAVPVAE